MGDGVEVPVLVEQRQLLPDGHGGDQAGHGLTLLLATPLDQRCHLVILGEAVAHACPEQDLAQLDQVLGIPSSRQHLHQDGVADGDVAIQQPVDLFTGSGTGTAQELHPGGAVDEDRAQLSRLSSISARSSSLPDPRSRRASSTESSAAGRRRAKLTAARLLGSW